MSLCEPNPDDIFAQLESQFSDFEELEVANDVNVQEIPDTELGIKIVEIDQKLSDMENLHRRNPNTEEARDLHSLRAALLIEQARRGQR